MNQYRRQHLSNADLFQQVVHHPHPNLQYQLDRNRFVTKLISRDIIQIFISNLNRHQ